MPTVADLGNRLYRGEISYDFVGRQRRWYAISAAILLVAVLALAFRGLTLGLEFQGGAEFQATGSGVTVAKVRSAVEAAGVADPVVTKVGTDQVRVQTETLDQDRSAAVQDAVARAVHVPADKVTVQEVGATWGRQITEKAVRGLVVFLLLVVVYLSLAFEWKMALAANVALVHDLLITVGIYSLVGFEVTPATVVGLLTILGYSLYDTVVVFDKVKENTRGLQSGTAVRTYSQAANLAVNQTLVRSVNTSVVALLPVGAILFVGAGLLGAGTLKDLALALFVGIAAGTYSSIFIATPLLADLKEREPAMQALARRVAARDTAPPPPPVPAEAPPAAPGPTVVAAPAERRAGQPPRQRTAPGSGRQPQRRAGAKSKRRSRGRKHR